MILDDLKRAMESVEKLPELPQFITVSDKAMSEFEAIPPEKTLGYHDDHDGFTAYTFDGIKVVSNPYIPDGFWLEVYKDKMVVHRPDGSTSVIQGLSFSDSDFPLWNKPLA